MCSVWLDKKIKIFGKSNFRQKRRGHALTCSLLLVWLLLSYLLLGSLFLNIRSLGFLLLSFLLFLFQLVFINFLQCITLSLLLYSYLVSYCLVFIGSYLSKFFSILASYFNFKIAIFEVAAIRILIMQNRSYLYIVCFGVYLSLIFFDF